MATPTISSFTPTSVAASGTALVITGTNFDTANVTSVKINGSAASFVITNGTTLTIAATPPVEAGIATVTVTNPTATATDTTGLTVTAYVVPTRNNVATPTGTFSTSGTTIFSNGLLGAYQQSDSNLWSTAVTAYPAYLAKVAKIKAVKLENVRRPLVTLTVPAV